MLEVFRWIEPINRREPQKIDEWHTLRNWLEERRQAGCFDTDFVAIPPIISANSKPWRSSILCRRSFFPGAAKDAEPVSSLDDSAPDDAPESLTAEQIRYALSPWLWARRVGRRAGRVILQDAAAVVAYHRKPNTAAHVRHTQTTPRELSRRGIDVHRIRSCLDSNFALYR